VKRLSEDDSVNVNWRDSHLLRTAMYRASGHGHTAVVEYFLQHPRVDLNMVSGEEGTPFNVACAFNYRDVVRLLLADPRIDVCKPMNTGGTPFMIAAEKGHWEVVALLLPNQRIDINVPNHNSSTGLWFASQNAHLRVVQMILASGREVDLTTRSLPGQNMWNDKSPAEIAQVMATRDRWARETPEEFASLKDRAQAIHELLEAYQNDPAGTRLRLWQTPGLREPLIGEVFAMVIFLADEFVIFREAPASPSNLIGTAECAEVAAEAHDSRSKIAARRFFRIANALPMDLQMLLCNRLFRSPKDIIGSRYSEPAFVRLALKEVWN